MSPPKGIGAAGALYVVAVAMLPWQWFPPFPWLHQHAQWGDVASAAAFVAWGIERARERPAWRPSPFQLACCVYLAFSAASLFLGNQLASKLFPIASSAPSTMINVRRPCFMALLISIRH